MSEDERMLYVNATAACVCVSVNRQHNVVWLWFPSEHLMYCFNIATIGSHTFHIDLIAQIESGDETPE